MKLIINGDDFGITHACNIAIIDCYRYGLMRSASMMTNMCFAEEAALLWKDYPELSVGIHFSLSAGRPLTEAKTLIKEDGTFDKCILRDFSHVDTREIHLELQAQFDRFVELTGRYPDHINSHHGIEAIPEGARIIQEYSRKYHLPIRSFLNKTADSKDGYQIDFQVPELKLIIKNGGKIPVYPEDIINSFSTDDLESDRIYELAGHPGYVDRDLLQISSLTEARCFDAYNFCCDQVKEWVQDNNIEIISYKDIPENKQR